MKYKLFILSLFILVLLPCNAKSERYNYGFSIGWTHTDKWNSLPNSDGMNICAYGSYSWVLMGADFTVHMTNPSVDIAEYSGHFMIGTIYPISKHFSLGATCNFGGVQLYTKDLGWYEGWTQTGYWIGNRYIPYTYYARYNRWEKHSYFDFGISLIQEIYLDKNGMFGITIMESTSIYSPITISIGICMMKR